MDKKKKVLICGILPPPTFGHSMLYQMLMNSRFVDEFDVTFLNMGFWTYGKHKKITADKFFKLVKYYLQFIWLVFIKRPDFVLYNISFYKMPFLKDALFCFTGRLLGCPYVIHDMGRYSRELYDSSSWMMKKIVRAYIKWAAASIIQGESVRSAYEGFVDQEKLWVVPGCVEDTGSLDVPVWERDGKVNVLYFSFLSKEKGIYTAFSVVPKVLEQNPAVKFNFAGPIESGKVKEDLNVLLERFPKNTEYLGYVEDARKRTEYFRNADIFIFPTCRETFGLVLLHAMAEKLPVIASTEGVIPEIVEEGKNGFLINKGDDEQLAERILRLASDQKLRETIGEANRKRYLKVYLPQEYERNMIEAFEAISQMSSMKETYV